MDYQEAIREAEIQINMYESMILYNKDFEPKNDNSNYERKVDFLKTAISAMQELQEQREIINKNKDYSEVQKWMQNIIDDAMVCLDEMKQDAKKNLNTHYSPLLYEGRKRKAKTVIYALIELNAYKQLGTLEEVREAVEKHKWIPCSERLPEDGDERFYMCIVENHEEDLPMFLQYVEDCGFGSWHDIYDEYTLGFVDSEFRTNEELGYEKVIAWMPLPEPYRPDKCHGCFGAANNDCERCIDGNEE